MSLHTRPCDLLVTDDSHMSDAISSRALYNEQTLLAAHADGAAERCTSPL